MVIAANGKKRPRSDPQPVDPSDLTMVVFHTLKKTPRDAREFGQFFYNGTVA